MFETVKWGTQYAYNTTADPQTAAAKNKTLKVDALAIVPAKTRRVYTCLYYDT